MSGGKFVYVDNNHDYYETENKTTMSEDFKWTDELVDEYAVWLKSQEHAFGALTTIEKFKKSKQNSFTIKADKNFHRTSTPMEDKDVICQPHEIKADKDNSGVSKDWEIVEWFNSYTVPCDGCSSLIKSVRKLSNNQVFKCGDVYENYGSLLSIVADKDYEILFRFSDGKHVANVIANALKKVKHKDWEVVKSWYVPGKSELQIQSVRRLSDNEVFSIGDKCEFGIGIREIEFFSVEFDKLMHVKIKDAGMVRLEDLTHAKPPLFKTDDGKDIYEKQPLWIVFRSFECEYGIVCMKYSGSNAGDFLYMPDNNKYFATKEAANAYVLINKQCLSLKDVHENMYADFDTRNMDDVYVKLKEIAQQKLNSK